MLIRYNMDSLWVPVVSNSTIQVGELTTNYIVPNVASSISNQVEISEVTLSYIKKLPSINTTVNIQESITHFVTFKRFITESVDIVENIYRAVERKRFLSSTVAVTDTIYARLESPEFSTDVVSISDSALYTIYDSTGKSVDTVSLVDNTKITRFLNRLKIDSISIEESIVTFFTTFINKTISSQVTISDSISYVIFQPIMVSKLNTVNISELNTTLITKIHSVIATVSISDANNVHITSIGAGAVVKSISGTVTLTETAVPDVYSYKTASAVDEVKHNYYSPSYNNILVALSITTQYFPSNIVITPEHKTINAKDVVIKYNYMGVDYSNLNIGGFRENIHQLKTIPNGAELDFGIVKDDTLKDFTIISGEPYNIEVEEILIPAFMGVDLVGLEVGSILTAGDIIEFQVLAYSDIGRYVIDDYISIKFVGGQMVQIFIKLTRVAVFDFFITPDRGSYKESLSFYTLMFQSIDNIRTSEVMMVAPKIDVSYNITVFQTYKHRAFLNYLRKGMVEPIFHPLWGQTILPTEYNENTYLVHCNWEPCDFNVGDTIFVFRTYDEYRLAKIVSLEGGRMLLDKKFSYEKGYHITPGFTGLVDGEVETEYTGERYSKGNLKFKQFAINA